MTVFTIDKNVPMPSNPFSKTGVTDVLRSLDVGDSIVINKSSRKLVDYLHKHTTLRFTSRLDGPNNVRIWRKA